MYLVIYKKNSLLYAYLGQTSIRDPRVHGFKKWDEYQKEQKSHSYSTNNTVLVLWIPNPELDLALLFSDWSRNCSEDKKLPANKPDSLQMVL